MPLQTGIFSRGLIANANSAAGPFDVSQPLRLDFKLQQIGISSLRIDQLSICPEK